MNTLLELLRQRPIFLIIGVIWLIGFIANMIKASKKARERRVPAGRPVATEGQQLAGSSQDSIGSRAVGGDRPGAVARSMGTGERRAIAQQSQAEIAADQRQQRSMMQAGSSAPSERQTTAEPQTTASPAMSSPSSLEQAVARRNVAKSPEQIAREMRRLLGLEPEAGEMPAASSRQQFQQQAAPLDPAAVHSASSEARMQQHIQSHVGESLRSRHMNKSKVGKTQSSRGAIGNLGGRVKARPKSVPVAVPRRIDMTDLRRVIVMNEILGPPVSLRPDSHRLL